MSLGQQRRSHWPWRRPPLVSSGSALSNTVVARCYSHKGFLLIESCPQREAATATRDQRWRCSTGEAPSAAERSRPSSSDPVNSHTFQTVALGRNFLSKQRSWSRMFLKCLPLPGGAVWSVPSKSVFTWGLHFHNHTFFFLHSFQQPVCSCCCVLSPLTWYKLTAYMRQNQPDDQKNPSQ